MYYIQQLINVERSCSTFFMLDDFVNWINSTLYNSI